MASVYTNDLRLEEIGTGEQSGTWGTTTNTNLELIAEGFSYGSEAIADASTHTITLADGASDEARSFYLKCTGGGQACTVTLAPNTISKVWMVENATSFTLTFTQGSGANVAILAGEVKMIATDGAGSGAVVYELLTDVNFAGTTAINALSLGGTAITTTAAEINLIDGGTSRGTTAVASGDGILINDGGTMRMTNVDTVSTYFSSHNVGGSNVVTTGALDSGSITSGFGSIDIGSSNLTATGTISLGATSFNDNNITNVGSIALDTITNDGTDVTIDSGGDIILDADGADVFLKDAGTTYGSLTNSSGNLIIKSGTTTALTFSGANATLAGDLTISGDDLTMGTNTSGMLLIADGTNFNPTAVTSLSEISTVANDDVFLAIDTSGGGLKKIARSAIVSGLATSGAISNVVEDTSPQLGGNLDTNSNNILIDDAHFIGDENGNEQIIFQTTSSAVNQFDVTNAATGSPPKISATGGDSNIDLDIEAKGTGHVTVRGNTNSGAIQFNCESNSHGQQVKAQPHSAAVTNVMLLPAGADSTLVSLVSTDILTNKTLTAPKIADGGFIADANGNELIVFQTTGSAVNEIEVTNNASGSNPIIAATGGDTNIGIALTPKGTGEIVIGASNLNYGGTAVTSTGAELNLLDGSSAGTIVNSKGVIYSSGGVVNATSLSIAGTALTATAAEFNLLDGGSTVGTTAVADGDGIFTNDGGTMRHTTVQTFATYFASEITAMSNLVTTGALNSGSITSGFGTINVGSSAITTTGTVNFGSLADGTITATAFVDEDDMSSNSATLIPTQQSVKAYADTKASTGKAIAMAIVFG